MLFILVCLFLVSSSSLEFFSLLVVCSLINDQQEIYLMIRILSTRHVHRMTCVYEVRRDSSMSKEDSKDVH